MNIINLPNEVLVHIFSYLYPDIPKLLQVCVAFNSICRSYKLMKFCKPYYRRLYNINGIEIINLLLPSHYSGMIEIPNIANGIYQLQLSYSNGLISKRICYIK